MVQFPRAKRLPYPPLRPWLEEAYQSAMKFRDYLQLVLGSIRFGRLRSVLTGLGITVGITAVVLLTAMGRGLEQYVLAQFTQFGTHVIAVIPGANVTMGISGAAINSTRPLSIEDAKALERISGD